MNECLTFHLEGFTLNCMNLKTVLTKDTISLHLKGTTKEQIIDELLDLLVKAGKIKDRQAAKLAVMDREQKMSTGMKHGIAIPHGENHGGTRFSSLYWGFDAPVEFDAPGPRTLQNLYYDPLAHR